MWYRALTFSLLPLTQRIPWNQRIPVSIILILSCGQPNFKLFNLVWVEDIFYLEVLCLRVDSTLRFYTISFVDWEKKKRKKEKKSRTQHLIFISCETDRTFKLQPNRNQYFSRKDSGEFSDHFFRDGKRMRYYPTLCHSHTLTASPTFSAARTPASYPATCRSALQTSNLRLILRNQ